MKSLENLPNITKVPENFNPDFSSGPIDNFWNEHNKNKPKKPNTMKKHFNLWNLFLTACLLVVGYLTYDLYKYVSFVNRVEDINARIDYLHKEEGYSILAAKHITDVEFGLCPEDAEYNALMED